ncbi:MAG: hypothetical protein ABI847_08065 [Anaerolineales bacterium]
MTGSAVFAAVLAGEGVADGASARTSAGEQAPANNKPAASTAMRHPALAIVKPRP